MSDLTLFHLYGSPNNTKVRIALGYFGVDYERVAVDFQDRAPVIAASGQPLTPAITDGDTAMFDSSAILRYLEANHSGEQSIFAMEPAVVHEIEDWERRTRGGGFGAPVGMMFGQFFKPEGEREAGVIEAAQEQFAEQCREVDAALGSDEYLVQNRLTAADCCIAPILNFGAPTDEFRKNAASDIGDFIMGNLAVPDDCPNVRAYIARVMAFDR